MTAHDSSTHPVSCADTRPGLFFPQIASAFDDRFLPPPHSPTLSDEIGTAPSVWARAFLASTTTMTDGGCFDSPHSSPAVQRPGHSPPPIRASPHRPATPSTPSLTRQLFRTLIGGDGADGAGPVADGGGHLGTGAPLLQPSSPVRRSSSLPPEASADGEGASGLGPSSSGGSGGSSSSGEAATSTPAAGDHPSAGSSGSALSRAADKIR